MKRTRSFARSRFWPFGAPEFTVPLVELLVFNIMFGLAPLVGGAIGFTVAGWGAVVAAMDPEDVVHRLTRPAPPGGQLVRRSVRLESADGPVCVVVHERDGGKSGWIEDRRVVVPRDPVATLESGETLALDPLGIDVGPIALVESPSFSSARMPSMPPGGRVRWGCLAAGHRVFVEGCVAEAPSRRLGRCGERRALVVPGGGTPQLAIDERGAHLAGQASLLGAAALIALLYGWIVLRARPLADALLRWSGAAPERVSWRAIAGLAGAPIALALCWKLGRWLWPRDFVVDRSKYIVSLAVVCAAAIIALFVRRRRRALALAIEPIRRAATIGLADARGEVVELAVRVPDDAPTVIGPLSGRPHAYAGVCITCVRKDGKNHRSFVARSSFEPNEVPIDDASGAGWLDLVNAEVDLRAVRVVVRSRGGNERARALVADLGMEGDSFVVEERFIDPGEQLYVLGAVERLEPARKHTTYRAAQAAPVIGGTNDKRVIVHAGSERTLLRALALERVYLDVALGVLGAVAAWVAITSAYFASL